MDVFVVEGGRRLEGRIRVGGSKNAALPLMAAALLTDHKVTLRDIPNLADIQNMKRLLAELGCHRINESAPDSDGVHVFHNTDQTECHARYEIVRTMRASICVLGPILAKRGMCRIAMPGGCSIGDRPVDLHLHEINRRRLPSGRSRQGHRQVRLDRFERGGGEKVDEQKKTQIDQRRHIDPGIDTWLAGFAFHEFLK